MSGDATGVLEEAHLLPEAVLAEVELALMRPQSSSRA